MRDADLSGSSISSRTRRSWGALVILCLVGLLGSSSGTLVSILIQPIKSALGLSDSYIGLLNGLAIAAVSAVAAFPLGMAADRCGRRRVLTYCILLWSLATLAMGLAPSKTIFVAGVVGINLGDAALIPMLYAMLPALFSGRERHIANSAMVATLVIGSYAVYGLGGLLLAFFEKGGIVGLAPWRSVCVVVTVAGIVMAGMLTAVPVRASASGPDMTATGFAHRDFLEFLRREWLTILLTFLGTIFYYTGFQLLTFWGPAIMERRFGVPTADANVALGFPLAAASGVGLLVASFILWRIAGKWGNMAGIRLMRVGCSLAFPLAIALPFAASATQFIWLMMALSVCFALCLALIPSVLQNCAPDRFRSRTIALYPLIALVTRILVPALVGVLSDRAGGTGSALLLINAVIFASSLAVSIVLLKIVEPRYAALARRIEAEDAIEDRERAVSPV